jgi:hypothetical protein
VAGEGGGVRTYKSVTGAGEAAVAASICIQVEMHACIWWCMQTHACGTNTKSAQAGHVLACMQDRNTLACTHCYTSCMQTPHTFLWMTTIQIKRSSKLSQTLHVLQHRPSP